MPHLQLRRAARFAVLALVATIATCTDNPAGPGHGGRAYLAIEPTLSSSVDLAAFGLVIDSLRLVIVRPAADTLVDTTLFFDPDSSQIDFASPLTLHAAAETLHVSVVMSAGGVPVFSGAQDVEVTVGGPGVTPPATIPLSFTGPGTGVTALHIAPADSVITLGDSLRFRVTADSSGVPITLFYVAWSTADTTRARINAFGRVRAPIHRDTITVFARTPTGVRDSTVVTFVPVPTGLVTAGGAGQTGPVGGPLAVPLRVRVTAADGLGVKAVPVQFSVVSGGGSIAAAPVATDSGGYAQTTATLGTVTGANVFRASAAGLTAVTFGATATAATPTQLLVSAGDGQTRTAGGLVTVAPAVLIEDTFNNPVPGVIVTFAVASGGGSVTQAIDTTSASGIATVGGWTLGTLAGGNTLTATAGVLSHTFTATGVPGPASVVTSLITVSADTLVSGSVATLSLRARDAFNNNLTAGGLTVAFSVIGGTSTGTLSAVTDSGNGVYSARFTGLTAGTVDTVHATIGGTPVTSVAPLLRVIPGAVSLATSLVTTDSTTLASGDSTLVHLFAKDANGNAMTAGGLTVVFATVGGGSTGTFFGFTDHLDGTYSAYFKALLAGAGTSIHATIGGTPVTSAAPLLTVIPGAISAATSTVTTSAPALLSGANVTLKLHAKDAAGNAITTGGAVVVFADSGGTTTGAISAATDSGTGVYTATFIGLLAGTATTIHATINGVPVTTLLPTVAVTAGAASPATSVVSVANGSIGSGAVTTVTLRAKDAAGNNLTSGGATVTFSLGFGTSTGAFGVVADSGNGVYTAALMGGVAGTPDTIHATINGSPVTSALPTLTVTAGVISAATSVITVASGTILSGTGTLVTLQAKDAAGNALTTGGATVVFADSGGTSTGAFSAVVDSLNGKYFAVFSGTLAGTATAIHATINGTPVSTAPPTVTVIPGVAATVAVTPGSIVLSALGATQAFTGAAHDAAGNLISGATFVWSSSDTLRVTVNSAGLATALSNGSDTIKATAAGGAFGTATVTVAQAASHLAFTVEPTAAAAGTAIAPAVVVTAQDSLGALVAGYGGSVTIAIGTNPAAGVLSGTLTIPAAGGLATFTDLKIDQPGIGYTLVATSGALTAATSVAFDVAPPGSVVFWTNAAGGNWSVPANWSSGALPALGDTAVINLSGTYTVTLDVNDTVGGLRIGGGSGTQTLLVSSKTLGVGGAMQVAASGVFNATSSTVNGGGTFTNAGLTKLRNTTVAKPLANLATLFADGTTNLTGAVTTGPSSLLRVQGNGFTGFSLLTVASGFANNGQILITDTLSSYGAGLTVTSGTLVNAAGASILADAGAAGARQLNAALNNQGAFTVSIAPAQTLTMTHANAADQNSGTITVTGGTLSVSQSGTSSFDHTGTLTLPGGNFTLTQAAGGTFTLAGSANVGAGHALTVSGGAFAYAAAGTLGGQGTFALQGGVTAAFTQNFTDDSLSLALSSATVNGPNTITNSTGRTLSIRSSTVNAPLVNDGTIFADGNSTVNGALTTSATSLIRVQGNGAVGFSSLTVASGFTNNGQILLTDTLSSYGAGLTVTAGTLVNAASASILADAGAGGSRQLNAELNNQGAFTISIAPAQTLTMTHANAAHQNSGTIALTGGALAITQSGAGSLTLSGPVHIASGHSLTLSGGAVNFNAGATLDGQGAVALQSGITANLGASFTNDSVTLTLSSATVNGPGTLTNALGHTITMRSSAINAPLVNDGSLLADGSSTIGGAVTTGAGSLLRVQGNGFTGFSLLTVANGFTNNGQILITDTLSSYGAGLTVTTGTLVNAAGASILADIGAAGSRQLNAELNNQGAFTVSIAPAQALTMTHANAADQNSGTITVTGGTLSVGQSGTSSFAHSGTLAASGGDFSLSQAATGTVTLTGATTVGSGRMFGVSGGVLNYNTGATISGQGTVALLAGVTANFTPSFTDDSLSLSLSSATVNGPGTITNTAGRVIAMRTSAINAPLVNDGSLLADGTSTLGGPVTTSATSLIRVQGNGFVGFSSLTVANGFTNNGQILITDTLSAYGAGLTVTNGTLGNTPGASILADLGAGGPRQLNAELNNQGTVTVSIAPAQTLTGAHANAADQNSGTFSVTSGAVTLTRSGTSSFAQSGTLAVTGGNFSLSQGATGTFTLTGALTVATGRTLAVTGGVFNYNTGATLGGQGTVALQGGITADFTPSFANDSVTLSLSSATVNGPGTITNAAGHTIAMRSTTINAPFVNNGALLADGSSTLAGSITTAAGSLIRVQGNGAVGAAALTATNGFTNNGQILLTDTLSAYGSSLAVTSGKLVNAAGATIVADSGAAGARTLDAELNNHGTLTVKVAPAQSFALNRASAADTNTGTITLTSGTFTVSGAGSSFWNASGGTITGHGPFNVSATTFTNAGNVNPGFGAGVLNVTGNYAQNATGALNIELGGYTAGTQYDRLVVNGTATIGGALNVTLINGFTPVLGDTFTVLTYTSRAGLGGLTLPSLGGGLGLDTVFTGTSLRLVVILFTTAHAADITTNSVWTAAQSPHVVTGYLKIRNGATLTIDPGALVRFDTASGLQVGDTALGESGGLVMDGTTTPITLTADSAAPRAGYWRGIELQQANGPQHWRRFALDGAGGLPAPFGLRSGLLIRATGADVAVDSARVHLSGGHGIAVYGAMPSALRITRSSVTGSQASGMVLLAPLAATDSIAADSVTGNGAYPLAIDAGALPALGPNAWTGNGRDTLLLAGGTLTGAATLQSVAGLNWRVTAPVQVDSGGALRVTAAQTVMFDSAAGIVVGASMPAAFDVMPNAPTTFTVTPGQGTWLGMRFLNLVKDDTLRQLIVDHGGTVKCSSQVIIGGFAPKRVAPLRAPAAPRAPQRDQIVSCESPSVLGAVQYDNTSPASVWLDSVTVRGGTGYAIEASPSGGGHIAVTHGQFYNNAYKTTFFAQDGANLTIDSSDIYHYGRFYQDAVIALNSSNDSLAARNNWWGDVAGPGIDTLSAFYNYADSIGRAILLPQYAPVAYAPFAAAPFFPVGSAATVIATPDSVVPDVFAGLPLPDSIRARAIDAQGRGVAGTTVTWGTGSGSGAVSFGPEASDAGGRVGGIWAPTTVAKLDTAFVGLGAPSARYYLNVLAGFATTANFELDGALTQGAVAADSNSATFTSTGRHGVIVTHARDAYGNVPTPSCSQSPLCFYFDDVPGAGFSHGYGTIDSVKADSVFFTVSNAFPVTFQIHASYPTLSAAIADSVILSVNQVGTAVQISNGYTAVDSLTFNSLCPSSGPFNFFCQRTVYAYVVDSAGAPLQSNPGYFPTWRPLVPGDTTVGIPLAYLSNFSPPVNAQMNGTTALVVDVVASGPPPLATSSDTVVITVQQVMGRLAVSPDSVALGLGDTTRFNAVVGDSGGTPLGTQPAVRWQIDPVFTGLVKVDSTANSLLVRFDSGVYNFSSSDWVGVVRPFIERAPGDTLFTFTAAGQGTIHNPIRYDKATGVVGSPQRAAVDTVSNRVFVTNFSGVVTVVDAADNSLKATTVVGALPIWLAVNHATNGVFVANNGGQSVSVLDGTSAGVVATVPMPLAGGIPSPAGVASDEGNKRIYVAVNYGGAVPTLIVPIDATTHSIITADTFRVSQAASTNGEGLAFNRTNGLLYLGTNDGNVQVLDPSAHSTTTVSLSTCTITDVAVNAVTDSIYAADFCGELWVIDGSTNAMVNAQPANTPQGLSVDETRNKIFFGSAGNNTVTVLDGATENRPYVIVGNSGDFPQAAAVDPRTGTVYAPHATALTILQFYGPGLGVALPAPPLRTAQRPVSNFGPVVTGSTPTHTAGPSLAAPALPRAKTPAKAKRPLLPHR